MSERSGGSGESSRGSCDKVPVDKANGGPIRKSLTIRETKVQELHSMDPGLKKRKLSEDLPRAARGQRQGVEDGSTRGRKEPFLTWREKSFATDEVAKLGMDARKTKVAAEKAVKAALELCKEKQSTATGSRNSTELTKRSTCFCRSSRHQRRQQLCLCVELRHR